MAGTATHYIFGFDVLSRLAGADALSSREREAFLMGNFGPDPFLFLKTDPIARRYRKIGRKMHRKKTDELLAAMHARFIAGDATSGVTRAYALGFLCHFLLDSAVHPLVYAQQQAICEAGIGDVEGRRAQRAIHATIETEADECLIWAKLGVTTADYPPHETMFCCPADVLAEVSQALADVIAAVYGIDAPTGLFAHAYRFNRVIQMIFDSKCSGVSQQVDYVELAGRLSPYLLAMSYKGEPRDHTVFANEDHVPWPHPWEEGAVVQESFWDLYDAALARAVELVPAYGNEQFDFEQCQALTEGLNFAGQKITH